VVDLINTDYIGKVALSKSGRDSGKLFIIVGIMDDNYVYISDGDLRSIEKPKKKKIKHLTITDTVAEHIKDLLQAADKVNNSAIKKYLQSMNSSEEV
jgi:large subunit ribosomal protein L14e